MLDRLQKLLKEQIGKESVLEDSEIFKKPEASKITENPEATVTEKVETQRKIMATYDATVDFEFYRNDLEQFVERMNFNFEANDINNIAKKKSCKDHTLQDTGSK